MKDLVVKDHFYAKKGSLFENRMGPGLCVYVLLVGGESKVTLKSKDNDTSLVSLAHPHLMRKIQEWVVMNMEMTLTSRPGPLIASAKTRRTHGTLW